MKKADCHLHPNILKEPDSADLFIKRAIELGFEEICFTDHMPFSVTGDEYDRIPFGKIKEYCEMVREKADAYKDKLCIKTGIEIDFHPDHLAEIEDVLSQGTFDYVIGSSHLNITGFGIPLSITTQTEFAKLVLENYLSAAKSGYFHTISHLDVYRWCFSAFPIIDDAYTYAAHLDLLHQIFEALEDMCVMLEVNAAPLYKNFDSLGPYPENEILNLAKTYKLKFIYGSDAHLPQHVGYGYASLSKLLS